jgi:hypothetical protein
MQGGTLPASCARSFETKEACVGVSENGGIRQNRPFKCDNYQTPLDFEVRIIKHHWILKYLIFKETQMTKSRTMALQDSPGRPSEQVSSQKL